MDSSLTVLSLTLACVSLSHVGSDRSDSVCGAAGVSCESLFDDADFVTGFAGTDDAVDTDDIAEAQPPQMTQEWWDLHYVELFNDHPGNLSSDPRKPGTGSEIFGNDLNDKDHFDCSMSHAEGLLRLMSNSRGDAESGWLPDVLVLGCGLSPLVFALADRGLGRIRCLEISRSLVDSLRTATTGLPRPPEFAVGDVTALLRAGTGLYWPIESLQGRLDVMPESFDLVIDENVLDGMGCTFPSEAGQLQQKRALGGIWRLLRPTGLLLTLSFLPLEQSSLAAAEVADGAAVQGWPLEGWRRQDLASAPREMELRPGHRPPLYAALWARPEVMPSDS